MFLRSLLVLGAAASSALAELSYTVSATHNGQEIDPATIELAPKYQARESSIQRKEAALASAAAAGDGPSTGSAPPTRPNQQVRRGAGPTYSSVNWCGFVGHSAKTNPITTAHAYYQVPAVSQRAGVNGYPQSLSVWVGIDGESGCSNGILQAGTDSDLQADSSQTHTAWFEWYPAPPVFINSFPVTENDWMEVTITMATPTSGKIVLTNLSQGYQYTISLSGGTALCQVDVDWIMEDNAFQDQDGNVSFTPFPSFSDTWMEGTYGLTANGNTVGVDGADRILMGSVCTPVEYDNSDFYMYSS